MKLCATFYGVKERQLQECDIKKDGKKLKMCMCNLIQHYMMVHQTSLIKTEMTITAFVFSAAVYAIKIKTQN